MNGAANEMADLVRSAASAVDGIDESLRITGFQLVLAELISRNASTNRAKSDLGNNQGRVKSRARTLNANRSDPAAIAATTLKLDVGQLRSLKNYCERFDLGGSEQIAFILANFIREHTSLDSAGPADIAYLYRQLVSQRVTVPAVNDISDWARALGWLTAPSRRKQWLEKSGTGYAVSNSGLLRFHELEEQAKSTGTHGNR